MATSLLILLLTTGRLGVQSLDVTSFEEKQKNEHEKVTKPSVDDITLIISSAKGTSVVITKDTDGNYYMESRDGRYVINSIEDNNILSIDRESKTREYLSVLEGQEVKIIKEILVSGRLKEDRLKEVATLNLLELRDIVLYKDGYKENMNNYINRKIVITPKE